MSLSAQEEHDLQMSQRKSIGNGISKVSRKRLEKLLSERSSSMAFSDPIEAARKNNPRLSREKAMEIAETFGF
jgi:hypothetical protein